MIIVKLFLFINKDSAIMKKLSDCLIENKINIDINSIIEEENIEIGNQIINEKLNNKYLKAIAKELSKNNQYYKKFVCLLGRCRFKWDKVDDSRSTYYNAGDKEGIKKAKAIIKRWDENPGIIIMLNGDDEPNRYIFAEQYIVIKTGEIPSEYKVQLRHGYREKVVPLKAKIIELEANNFVIIDLQGLEKYELTRERSDNRNGMVYLDPANLRNLAEANRKRYKTEAAKIRQSRINGNEDEIAKKVNETVNKVYDIVMKITKNPVDYADKIYNVETLQHRIYGERLYVGYKRGKSEYKGIDGLLTYFSTYVKYKMNLANGKSYDAKSDERAMDGIKDRIIKQIGYIDEYIEEYFKED